MNLGYACINTGLSANRIMTNRTMRRKTFDTSGIDYVSDLALANVKDLKTIVQWNNEMGIKLFRLSSQIFPWSDEYDITHLKDMMKLLS
jgi:UV DNA damage endonuclease